MQAWEHSKQDEPKAHVNHVVVEGPRLAGQLGRVGHGALLTAARPQGGHGACAAPGRVS